MGDPETRREARLSWNGCPRCRRGRLRVTAPAGGREGSRVGFGGLLPGGDRFRLYTITGSFPVIPRSKYRLEVTGLVDRPLTLTVDDLEAMPSTKLVKDFQCVTGWRVPQVHWEGVKLSDVLDAAGVKGEATGLNFESYDGADSESLTLDQARLPDVIVAYRMLGAPVTTEHGGPVRLYVAPMFGYKSLKWLSAIRVVAEPTQDSGSRTAIRLTDGSTDPRPPPSATTTRLRWDDRLVAELSRDVAVTRATHAVTRSSLRSRRTRRALDECAALRHSYGYGAAAVLRPSGEHRRAASTDRGDPSLGRGSATCSADHLARGSVGGKVSP